MPIVEVRALPQKPEADAALILSKVCERLATLLDLPARGVWGTWETIAAGHYVEGDRDIPDQESGSHPPLVRVITTGRPSEETGRRMLECVAETITEFLGLERENIVVFLEKKESSDVFPGGSH